MPFSCVVEPEAVDMLRRLLDAHCEKFGILAEDDRISIALSLLALYQNGVTDEAQLAILTERKNRFSRENR